MKTLIISFLLLSLISCAKAPKDSDLIPYLESFKSLANRELNSEELVLQFGDLQAPVVGTCASTGIVTIDKVYWENSPDELREELMFHELGHCLLGRQHRTDILSIMNPYVIDGYTYRLHRTELLQELFN